MDSLGLPAIFPLPQFPRLFISTLLHCQYCSKLLHIYFQCGKT